MTKNQTLMLQKSSTFYETGQKKQDSPMGILYFLALSFQSAFLRNFLIVFRAKLKECLRMAAYGTLLRC